MPAGFPTRKTSAPLASVLLTRPTDPLGVPLWRSLRQRRNWVGSRQTLSPRVFCSSTRRRLCTAAVSEKGSSTSPVLTQRLRRAQAPKWLWCAPGSRVPLSRIRRGASGRGLSLHRRERKGDETWFRFPHGRNLYSFNLNSDYGHYAHSAFEAQPVRFKGFVFVCFSTGITLPVIIIIMSDDWKRFSLNLQSTASPVAPILSRVLQDSGEVGFLERFCRSRAVEEGGLVTLSSPEVAEGEGDFSSDSNNPGVPRDSSGRMGCYWAKGKHASPTQFREVIRLCVYQGRLAFAVSTFRFLPHLFFVSFFSRVS